MSPLEKSSYTGILMMISPDGCDSRDHISFRSFTMSANPKDEQSGMAYVSSERHEKSQLSTKLFFVSNSRKDESDAHEECLKTYSRTSTEIKLSLKLAQQCLQIRRKNLIKIEIENTTEKVA